MSLDPHHPKSRAYDRSRNILSSATVLGTLAVYHDQSATPHEGEAEALRYLPTIASVAIGRSPPTATGAAPPTQEAVPLSRPGARSGHGASSLQPYVAASSTRNPEIDQ